MTGAAFVTLAELRAIADSLRPRLAGGQIQRIRQPDDEHLVLTVRGRAAAPAPAGAAFAGGPAGRADDGDALEDVALEEIAIDGPGVTWDVLVCVRPRASRVHLTWRSFAPSAAPGARSSAPSPPAFTQRLRATVLDGRVRDVTVPWADRVLAFDLTHAGAEFRLLVEITGHHANAFLVDGGGVILASLRPTASRRRDLRPGHPYVPPLPPDDGAAGVRVTPLVATGEALHREIDARFAARDVHDALFGRAAALRRRLKGALGRAERRKDRIAEDLARAAEGETLRHQGELLAASLYAVRKGMSEIDVVDWTRPDGGTVRIPLDVRRTPQENLEDLFARYRKRQRAAPVAEGRLAQTGVEAAALRTLVGRLDALALPSPSPEPPGRDERGSNERGSAPVEAALAALERDADALGVPGGPRHEAHGRRPHGRKAPTPRRLPYKAYAARDGTTILVGRGGADNGSLTFRVAREGDPWLHVRDGAGAHVIVRRERKQPVSRETLLDAALLAAHFSKRRDEPTVEVHVTPRRFVRPLKGAPPGTVRVERSETLAVGCDPGRLERLLATRTIDGE